MRNAGRPGGIIRGAAAMGLSFQLYSARNTPSTADFLRELGALGYAHVEGFPGVYDDPVTLRTTMDDAGLTMPSGHFPLEMVRDEVDRVLDLAEMLGIETIIVPIIDPRVRDAAGWRDLGESLSLAGEPYWDKGMNFGWHNHDFEFARLESGEMPLDLILGGDARLALELDLAWVARAGQNPADWITQHADRLVAVHVKDIAPEGTAEDEDGWADVGYGILPWPALKAQLAEEAPTALHVVEHDNPSDPLRFARRSIAAYEGM